MRVELNRPWITDEDKGAVMRVLDSGDLMGGKEVAAFEEELAIYLKRKYVVCVSSGTVALMLAQREDPTPYMIPIGAFGFIATPNAIRLAGMQPYFEDKQVAETTLGEVPDKWEEPEDWVIDAAQAFGAKLPKSLADCYSFNSNKPICCGGGCVATDDPSLAARIVASRNQGRSAGNLCERVGGNFRMTEMSAALGRSQLRRIEDILQRRRNTASCYLLQLPASITRPFTYVHHSMFMFPIEVQDRDRVCKELKAKGVEARSCADWLLPAHPYYASEYKYKRGNFPNAEARADRTLLLPIWPKMTIEHVETVCQALREIGAKS